MKVLFLRSKGAMELYSHQNGATIQRNWSYCLQKYLCFESWSFEAEERSYFHSLQRRFYELRTLVPNSFCKSARYLRSRGELVFTIRFNRRRKGTSQCSSGQYDFDPVETRRITTLGISSDKSNWKQDASTSLAGHIQLTQLCEKAYFQYRFAA